MTLVTKIKPDTTMYLNIVGGSLREKTEPNVPGAIERVYEYKKEIRTKWEMHYSNLRGTIIALSHVEGTFGEQVIITVAADGEVAKLYLNVSSRYFSDFAKKIHNANIEEEITIHPFDFISDRNGKQITGITLTQDEVKLTSFFWDGTNTLNGSPVPIKEKDGTMDWKKFFIKEQKFLLESLIPLAKELKDRYPDVDTDTAEPAPMSEVFPRKGKKKESKPDLDSMGIEDKI